MPTLEQTIQEFRDEIRTRLTAIERSLASTRPGPYGTPSGFATPGPVDEADVDAAMAQLGDLGSSFPGEAFVRGWLAKGYSVAQVVAAIDGVLAPHLGKGGELDPANPRAGAAYLVTVAKDGGWAKQVRNRLEHRDPGPTPNPNPESNLLAGLSNVNGPADLVGICDEVIARAERGVDWSGMLRLGPADLAEAKAVLADRSKWRSEWLGWADDNTRKVVLFTGGMPAKWEGSQLLSPYPYPYVAPAQLLPEYLFDQYLAQKVGGPS